jgi:small-conductance mechanosensitive channel
MSKLQKIGAAALIALLAIAGWGLWATQQSTAPVQAVKTNALLPAASRKSAVPIIDQNTYFTAQHLARLANTPDEQPFAQAAVQVADHELDLAFAAVLRYLEANPPPLSAEATRIQQHLDNLQKVLAADSDSLKRLQAQLAQASDAEKPAIQDRLDLLQSQVELEQDEVQEANNDLMQAGGNQHQRIQMMQQEHQTLQRNAAAAPPVAAASPLGTLRGMFGKIREWLTLHRKDRWLREAQQQAANSATLLASERAQIAAQLAADKARIPEFSEHKQHVLASQAPSATATQPAPGPQTAHAASTAPVTHAPPKTRAASTAQPAPVTSPAPTSAAPSSATPATNAAPKTLLELTRQMAAEQRRLTLRDERITDRRRLAEIYGQWEAVVGAQARTVLHEILTGALIVLAALLLLLVADHWLERLLSRARIDRRQLATLHSVVGVSLQLVGLLVIVLVLIGLPGQIGTMLGIVGAGLTVALKDFIVAFIGWFVLMGRNGIRLGDWVEINGVSGEVVELNMFHTVLLETGNWTDAGHPTGRRVTFTNSFAIGNHYFNFSTSGQWLWDELTVVVPYDRDPHAIADALQKEVTEATAKDASSAEQEWRRAARGRGVSFSLAPALAIRPSASGSGVDIALRYVTRANERLALRSKLYQSAVQLLAQHPERRAVTG